MTAHRRSMESRIVGVAVSSHRRVLVQTPPSERAPSMTGRASGLSGAAAPRGSGDPAFGEGRDAGFRQGVADARRHVEDQLLAARQALEHDARQRDALRSAEHQLRVARLDALFESLQDAERRRAVAFEDHAIELAFEAVCGILGARHDAEANVARAVRAALQGVSPGEIVSVHFNPTDLARWQSDEDARQLMHRYPNVAWMGDATLETRECRIGTVRGCLQAGLRTQLERLKALWEEQPCPDAGESRVAS